MSLVRPKAASFVLTMSLIATSTASAFAQSDDVSALVARVAQTYAGSTRGVLGVRSTSDLLISAPFLHKKIHDESWYIFQDGALTQSSKAPDPRQPPLHDPYRMEYVHEYSYAFVKCSSCSANVVTIRFDSPAHDVAHARGTLLVDRATDRIISSSETPYQLPWPTKSGSLDASWGPVAGTWLPTDIRGDFVGRIGPFVGHARYRQRLSQYAFYPAVSDAFQTLRRRNRS